MIYEMSRDFKCVFVQFRAQGGVPITSPKFYCMGAWTDLKEPIDYISKKLDRPMFLFATSLGAICSTLYLIND
jgi:predicted alpha/beta-fold hydrolase